MDCLRKRIIVHETVICKCGCGKTLEKYDSRYRVRNYILGHNPQKKRISKYTGICIKCNKPFNHVKRKSNKNYGIKGMCLLCYHRKYYDTKKVDVIFKLKISKRVSKAYYQLKKIIFDHYGSICVCCGETEPKFLVIDHVNNDGYLERKKMGAHQIMKKIIAENFPNTYQILCFNCNTTKGFFGQCPHQEKRNG